MPLRLDNAKSVAHMPTAEQQQTKKDFKPRFKVDHAASPMPETRQPERLAPRATSNRNGGRDHLGILGEIKSVHPGEIIGISTCSKDQRKTRRGEPAPSPLIVRMMPALTGGFRARRTRPRREEVVIARWNTGLGPHAIA
jgi:hypothetical protein